jgi:ElaB/YqjD/DUF883 family membrane-anchored ribosome-binding protein
MISHDRRGTLRRDLNAVRDDLRRLRSDTGVLAKNAFDAGKDSAVEAKGYLHDTLRSASIRGRWGLRKAGEQIGKRPGTAVAAAFGMGLVLGLVFLNGRR